MTNNKFSMIKSFIVYKYLLENSDENHAVTSESLCAYLDENLGMPTERRSIYREVEAFNVVFYALKYGLDIDEAKEKIDQLEEDNDHSWKTIVYTSTGNRGFFIKERYFDIDSEYTIEDIKVIAECIYSAKFITEKKAKDYVNIITKVLTSKYQANEIKHDALLLDRGKTLSTELFDNISKINKAIKTITGPQKHEPEKISFKYLSSTLKGMTERRHGERYIVNPYKIIINDGNYYLLALDDKQQKTMNYRIDRMKDVRLLGIPRNKSELFKTDDARTEAMRTFGMFDGKKEPVTLQFINILQDAVKDKFGNKAQCYKADDTHFRVQVDVPITDQFFGWLCSFGRRVKIISPERIQNQFKEYLDKIRNMY